MIFAPRSWPSSPTLPTRMRPFGVMSLPLVGVDGSYGPTGSRAAWRAPPLPSRAMPDAFPQMPIDNPDVTETLRSMLDKLSTSATVRRFEDRGCTPDTDLWDELVRGGWAGLAIPEGLGGGGASVADLHLALHELGHAAAPVPYRSSAVLVGMFLAAEPGNDAAAEIVGAVVGGEMWSPAVTEARWLRDLETRFDGSKVSGRKLFVSDAGAASSFLVLALGSDGSPVWVAVDGDADGIERRLVANTGNDAQYEVVFNAVAARVVSTAPVARWNTLERFTSTAWALGLMTRAIEIAVDHVKERVQFGRPIGTFQAVQHRLADSVVDTQASINLCRSAAVHLDESGLDDPATTAAIAELFYAARRAAVRVARDTHQVLGGVGFSLEHDLQLYTRRVKAFSVLGELEEHLTEEIATAGPNASTPDGAALTFVPTRPEDEQLRNDVRAFLDEEFPVERQIAALIEQHEHQEHIDQVWERAFWKQLAERGWLGLGIPEEYGGSGGTAFQRYVFIREMSYYGAPYPRTATQIVAPAVFAFGSDEVKQRFLPRIAAGEINCCLGYTEPDAGTDLASLRTRAVREGDGYIVNGQKLYTTRAHRCEYAYMAVRTDPDAPKHAGISVMLLDMQTPGVTIEPLYVLGGRTNITTYEDVFVDAGNLVGEENKGWRLLTHSLGLERIAVFPTGHIQRFYEELDALARRARPDGTVPFDSAVVRSHLVNLQVDMRVLQALMDGAMAEVIATDTLPNYLAAAIKSFLTEYKQRLADVGMQFLAPYGQYTEEGDDAPFDGIIETMWRDAIVHTFGGGANEVQRDIIANSWLGLPRIR